MGCAASQPLSLRAAERTDARSHLPGADGLRAVACLWVFAAHGLAGSLPGTIPGALPGALPGADAGSRLLRLGGMGVPIFFVLSGFLLSQPFWKSWERDRSLPSLRVYFLRRLARILPAYIACLLVLTLVLKLYADRWNVLSVLSCLTFTSSFSPATYTPSYNGPLWSVSVEMWFYILLPGVAWLCSRCPTRTQARLVVVSLIVLLTLGQALLLYESKAIEQSLSMGGLLFQAGSSATQKNVLMLFAHFLIGTLAADAYLTLRGRRPTVPQTDGRMRWNRYDSLALGAGAWGVLGLLGWLPYPTVGYMHYGWPGFHLLVATLLVTLPFSATLGHWLDCPPLRLTATLSYGLYIWHIPILNLVHHYTPEGWEQNARPWLVFSIAIVATYLVAAISYVLIERPILRWAQHREALSPPAATTPGTTGTSFTRQHRAA